MAQQNVVSTSSGFTFVGSTQPDSLDAQVGDTWQDTRTSPPTPKVWNGTEWKIISRP